MLIGFLVLSVFWALISEGSVTPTNRPKTKRVLVALVVILAGGALCLAWLKEVRAYHSAMVVDKAFYYENVPPTCQRSCRLIISEDNHAPLLTRT
jgi:hypothetical protein